MNETHVLIMGANSSLIRLVELLRQRQYKITIVSKQLPEDTAAFHDCTLIRNDFLAKSSLDQLPTNDIEIAICLAEHHEKDSKEGFFFVPKWSTTNRLSFSFDSHCE